jgi:hypothetical protein
MKPEIPGYLLTTEVQDVLKDLLRIFFLDELKSVFSGLSISFRTGN